MLPAAMAWMDGASLLSPAGICSPCMSPPSVTNIRLSSPTPTPAGPWSLKTDRPWSLKTDWLSRLETKDLAKIPRLPFHPLCLHTSYFFGYPVCPGGYLLFLLHLLLSINFLRYHPAGLARDASAVVCTKSNVCNEYGDVNDLDLLMPWLPLLMLWLPVGYFLRGMCSADF